MKRKPCPKAVNVPGPWRQYKDLNIYVNPLGDVKYYTRGGNEYLFTKMKMPNHRTYKCGYCYVIKSHNKRYTVKNLVWNCFVGEVPKGYFLVNKNGIPSCNELSNLKVVDGIQYRHEKCHNPTRTRFVIDHTHNTVYKGSTQAGLALHLDSSSIVEYCNGKVKNPLYDLEWGGLVSGLDLLNPQ